ncbi:hypothetical protein [Eubacterium sp.]|uniref:hypothetical protein n=1 Tax=Eubacterium sp. TaxID=142586 RepID=UPI002584889E|nr:hypothetical protein [Eubacterium sp.]MCR5367876.1 hypothetical protein [Eubacterium sp.]
MVKDFWKQVRLYCMEHGKDSFGKLILKPMIEDQYGHALMKCACCAEKSETNKDGYEELDDKCSNSINFEEYQKIVSKLHDTIEADASSRIETDYTGMRIPNKKYIVRVIKQNDRHFDIGIERKVK